MTRKIVFVTGGAGFIGSNIVEHLSRDLSLDLVVCDRLGGVESGKWRNIAHLPIGDVVAPRDMFDWLEKRWREVELVIHMAAVEGAENDVDTIIHGNFGLSRDLFRWCADRQRRLLWASSEAVYGDGSHGFDDTQDLEALATLLPASPIGWSKALFDFFAVRQAARDYAPPQWAGLRLFGVYGPHEGHKGPNASLASQFLRAASRGNSVQLFRSHRPEVADGEQTRDFTYVADVAAAAEWFLQNPATNGVFNLGSGQGRSLNDLARLAFAAVGQAPKIDYVEAPESIRSRYRYAVEAPMQRLRDAGFTPPSSALEDGLTTLAAAIHPEPRR